MKQINKIRTLGNIKEHYYITTCGKVLSTYQKKQGDYKMLKTSLNNSGHQQVSLSTETGAKRYAVHRLIALAFIPNPDKKPKVGHINETKTDNYVQNLEWTGKVLVI